MARTLLSSQFRRQKCKISTMETKGHPTGMCSENSMGRRSVLVHLNELIKSSLLVKSMGIRVIPVVSQENERSTWDTNFSDSDIL